MADTKARWAESSGSDDKIVNIQAAYDTTDRDTDFMTLQHSNISEIRRSHMSADNKGALVSLICDTGSPITVVSPSAANSV